MNASEANGPGARSLEERISASALPVLVDVSSAMCPPCRQLSALLPALQLRFDGVAHIIEVEAADEPAFVAHRSVSAFPSLLLFDKGELLDRIHGFKGYEALVCWLNEQIPNTFEDDPRREAPDWEVSFAAHAAQAEARYAATILPSAEAVGRVLEAAFNDHQALVARLHAESRTSKLSADADAAIRQSHKMLVALGAPELVAQRRISSIALARYRRAIDRATAALPGAEIGRRVPVTGTAPMAQDLRSARQRSALATSPPPLHAQPLHAQG